MNVAWMLIFVGFRFSPLMELTFLTWNSLTLMLTVT